MAELILSKVLYSGVECCEVRFCLVEFHVSGILCLKLV